ncbi:MAG TPA: L-histidine N(alpha)-methyltransferase [Candidatus Polarisedimenticolia bacterium]|nr:L-histidine N(alpha)-methyltransferase [Candidatus Polarisedimenticolia bacterium]
MNPTIPRVLPKGGRLPPAAPDATGPGGTAWAPATSPRAPGFAADVRHYLTQRPRQLPSRYFYDDLGSALFEAICRLPWYPLTRAENRLLEAHGREILDGGVRTILELGPGSGEKLSALLAAAGTHRGPLDLHLVDVSGSALAQAERTLEEHAEVRIAPHRTTYEAGLDAFARADLDPGRRLALFLGSNIGNFDRRGRDAFLGRVRSALRPGDALLLGADLVKPEGNLILAYDDPLGVTAAFNLNLLSRVNRELRGDFDLDGFGHRALWNETESRVEMHLRSRWRQRITVRGADLTIIMEPGETIWTESSYKYRPPEIAGMLDGAGFRVRQQWIEAIDRFALTLAEAC